MKRKQTHLLTIPKDIMVHLQGKGSRRNDFGLSTSLVYDYGDMILKVDYKSEETINEARMCGWLHAFGLAPRIICEHVDQDVHFILMEKIQGLELMHETFITSPEVLIDCLVDGLKRLWQVPIEGCPSRMTIDRKLALAQKRIKQKAVDMKDWDDDVIKNRFKKPEDIYDYLDKHKHHEHLVMSHGDFCLPNILYEGRTFKGFIDLGRAGLSSKWQDIALCVRSLTYNLGTDQYTELFFEKLGIEPNHDLIDYYQLMDELF